MSSRSVQMSRIVAGVFDDHPKAEGAVAALVGAGFAQSEIEQFVVSPAGRHHQLPMGGDEKADQGSTGGEQGALAGVGVGAAVGAVAGLIATPLVGPIAIAGGMAAGAYAGSFAGAMGSLGEPVEKGVVSNIVRPSGVMIAAHAQAPADEDTAARALRQAGARTVEWNSGTWRNGHWTDFDPVADPERIESYDQELQELPPEQREPLGVGDAAALLPERGTDNDPKRP